MTERKKRLLPRSKSTADQGDKDTATAADTTTITDTAQKTAAAAQKTAAAAKKRMEQLDAMIPAEFKEWAIEDYIADVERRKPHLRFEWIVQLSDARGGFDLIVHSRQIVGGGDGGDTGDAKQTEDRKETSHNAAKGDLVLGPAKSVFRGQLMWRNGNEYFALFNANKVVLRVEFFC